MTTPRMPRHRSDITAQWMQQALTAGGASDLPAIQEVALEDIGAGLGMSGEILRCHLTWQEQSSATPATVIVKLPSACSKILRMSKRMSLYRREYDYYRLVAPHAPLRTPALLYGVFEARGQRSALVLEDLRAMQTVNQVDGASAAQAKRAIRALAGLHATFWNKVDRPPLTGYYTPFTPQRRALVQLAFLATLAPTLERFENLFSDEMRGLAEAYAPRVADHIAEIAAGPRTFIHGDFRLDNVLFAAGEEEDFAVIDWQVSGLSSPLYDVAYFLANSVSTGVRRQIERAALQEYTDIVCGMGARGFTFAECWRLYRQNMLGAVLAPVMVCGGLDLTGERGRQLAEVGLRRTLAAIEDLDAAEFLPARRGALSLANAFSTFSRGAYSLLKALR